jgi:3-deoxy-D-manno-octulosonic-acid transferase
MIRFVYNLLFPVVLLLLLPAWMLRMIRRGNWRRKFLQRFGIYTSDVYERVQSQPRDWIHAVSVGEVLIALKLARQLKRREPDAHFVLSTTTATGFALAEREAPDWIEVIYNPVDLPWCVGEAFDLIRPARLVLVEAEIWPNLVHECVVRGVPVGLVNARLSPRSERRYLALGPVVTPIFRKLDLVCVQEPADLDRWSGLGISPVHIQCTGSIKFDPDSGEAPVAPDEFREVLARAGAPPNAAILLAGSTHPGEEGVLAAVFCRLRPRFPELFLVVAPRHVERTPEVLAALAKQGLRPTLRTQPGPGDCLVLDSTGELRRWYPLATVVFVGKSLMGSGGQNPVEPAYAGVPVVCGPGMENFAAVTRSLVKAGGMVQVADLTALEAALERLLSDPTERMAMPARARAALEPHRGATDRTAELVLAFLRPQPPAPSDA